MTPFTHYVYFISTSDSLLVKACRSGLLGGCDCGFYNGDITQKRKKAVMQPQSRVSNALKELDIRSRRRTRSASMGDETFIERISNDFQNAIFQFDIHKLVFRLPPIESTQSARLILSPARLAIARERRTAGRDASLGRTPATTATATACATKPTEPVARRWIRRNLERRANRGLVRWG